jgi:NADH-quinone oxidoreductase subunit J
VQIILYVGGIMVLFLFVIMLVNIERNMREHQFNKQWLVATVAALVLGGLFGYVYLHGKQMFTTMAPAMAEQTNTQKMGEALYVGYTFPFEIASVLLLVAIIGAVVMAKKRI